MGCSFHAGVGVVVRNEFRDVVKAVSHSLEHWDCTQVELFALLSMQWLVCPEMQDVGGIIVEGDNLNIINFVQHQFHRRSWET